jgi:uncharacterized protein with LGFP repeats
MPTRHVVAAATLLVAAPAAVPQTIPHATAAEDDAAVVRGWTVDLDRSATRHRGQQVAGRHPFSTVGVTWARGDAPLVEVRTRADGSWTPWQEVHELAGAPATEPIWVDASDAVRVRVSEWRRDLEVVLIDPGEEPAGDSDAAARRTTMSGATSSSLLARRAERDAAHAPMPRLRLRDDWGARERWRTSDPVYLDKIKQAHIHHTAGSNRYSRGDVPGIIRSMYWYHTKQLGWSDLGYNFLVDRFGRLWVGRAGGFRKRVRGAHTLGFNHASFGVAFIGNTEKTRLNERAKGALVRLVAWKLDKDGRAPGARKIRVYSQGSDRFPAGDLVRLPATLAHRRTNLTACPGEGLYDFIPRLRERAQVRADSWG